MTEVATTTTKSATTNEELVTMVDIVTGKQVS